MSKELMNQDKFLDEEFDPDFDEDEDFPEEEVEFGPLSTTKLYTNLKYMDRGRDFFQDLCDYADKTGLRRRGRFYSHEERRYVDNMLEPLGSFQRNLAGRIRTKQSDLLRSPNLSEKEKDRIRKIKVPWWSAAHSVFNRIKDGKFSPSLIALLCETAGVEYKFISGDMSSRRGAISVNWEPKQQE